MGKLVPLLPRERIRFVEFDMVFVKYPVICLCLAFSTSPVLAQEEKPVQDDQPLPSRRISAEESEATGKLETLGFSHYLNFSEDTSTQVVRAYTSSQMRSPEATRNGRRNDTQPNSPSDPKQSPFPGILKRYNANDDGKLKRIDLPGYAALGSLHPTGRHPNY